MAQRGYKLHSGEKVPSVTTILGKFKDPSGLVHWAWALGRDGRDYRQVRDDAASAGTLAHLLVESDIRNQEVPEGAAIGLNKETVDAAFTAYRAYQSWREVTGLLPSESEVSLVSERFKYGGTFDALGDHKGRTILVDWKTSEKPQPQMLAQIGAYAQLWEEWHPERLIDGGWILLFSRTTSQFRAFHYTKEQLVEGATLFLLLRNAWEVQKRIEKYYDVEGADE